MMRQLRLKPVPETPELSAEIQALPAIFPDIPARELAYMVSLARQYQNQGLRLTQLVAAGEEGRQWALRNYGLGTEQHDRWGMWWVRQSMLMALNAPLTDGPGKE